MNSYRNRMSSYWNPMNSYRNPMKSYRNPIRSTKSTSSSCSSSRSSWRTASTERDPGGQLSRRHAAGATEGAQTAGSPRGGHLRHQGSAVREACQVRASAGRTEESQGGLRGAPAAISRRHRPCGTQDSEGAREARRRDSQAA